MSFNSSAGRTEYTATAAQVVFPFAFKIYQDEDIKVYQTPSGQIPDDAVDILTLVTDYTVTINGDLGGEITLVSGAGNGDALTLLRKLDIDRLIEYQTSGDLLASTLNGDQDYQTYLIADREADAELHVRLPDSAQNVSVVLESPVPDAYIKWNAAADQLENDTSIPTNVTNAELYKWEAEASNLTSESYATEFVDGAGGSNEFVNVYSSDGDGTFTVTPQTDVFSSKWHDFNTTGEAQSAREEAWNAEAEKLTADSYATEAEDVFVKLYTSDGDGTFSFTNSTDYSSLHWAAKSAESSQGSADNISVSTTNFDKNLSVADTDVQKALETLDNSAVSITGDTMTGALNVPSGATGTQVPRVQEVATLSGDNTFTGQQKGISPVASADLTRKDYVDSGDIGVDQTWQDVKASRAQDVTYTNNTGKPIAVAVGLLSAVGAKTKLRFYVNGLKVIDPIAAEDAGVQNRLSVTVIVPNGGTYLVDDDNVTCTISTWTELRGV